MLSLPASKAGKARFYVDVRLALRRPYTFVVMAPPSSCCFRWCSAHPVDIFPDINIPVIS